MMERVYIETTFVSYLTARASRDVVIAGHQQSTKEWWDDCRGDYQLCASELVFREPGAGDPQAAQERLDVLKDMLLLETRQEAQDLANANKFGHIRRINTSLGLFIPALVTPLELLGVDHEFNA